MSYPRDLDEMSADELQDELNRRAKLKDQGLCTYCERPLNALPPCRFLVRHSGQEL